MSKSFDDLLAKVSTCSKKKLAVAVAQDKPVLEAVMAAKERGMYDWVYDENGWPSGFGSGIVNGKGEHNQQKYLRYDESTEQDAYTLCFIDGKRFYYEVNPFYVDTLNGRVTEEFIQTVYEPYYEKFKNARVSKIT